MIATDIHLSHGGYEADISSLRGGICFRLCHMPTGADLLRTPRDEEHLRENVYLFGNPPLFPPNRIVGGIFDFNGRTYTLPLNEPSTGCHIHGALWEQAFEIETLTESSVKLVYRAEAGEYIHFPHAFTFIREYRLDESGLWETDTVQNRSDLPMPFMLAYHTTFNLPFLADGKRENLRLTLPVGREEMRTEKFIPTGEFRAPSNREREMQKGEYVPYGKHLSAFYECNGEMLLTDTESGVSISYVGDDQYPYRMLFQTADGTFWVCEPQTCAIDCFHLDGDPIDFGLIVLSPNETRQFKTRISVKY